MTTSPTAPGEIGQETHAVLSGLAVGDLDVLTMLGVQEAEREASGLDARAFALVKIAALVALDAPPASFVWQIGGAVSAGVTPEDIVGVLTAVAPQVGMPKVVAAAPEIMLALGLTVPEEPASSNAGGGV
jgi:alkylhydroperoxidase/carboxymuconolactone decarboxylase family protein YurZ